MIVEERYGNRVNAEEFSVEVKRGYLFCGQDKSTLLYLIGRSKYTNREGREKHTSEVLRREAFSREKLEAMLDEKDRLKAEQEEINAKVREILGGYDPVEARRVKIEKGWALREADE
ncbi:MAG: hypothetical protein LUC27_03710 [Lachnospiraceae bacterium]|nr:hypothetical protein [Lachnospiraceae bacterium]